MGVTEVLRQGLARDFRTREVVGEGVEVIDGLLGLHTVAIIVFALSLGKYLLTL